MVARHQHLRHRPALPDLRPCVVRVFEQTRGKTLFFQCLGAPEDPGQQPHAGIDQRNRGRLAARQHEVAETDLLDRPCLDDTLVNALEAPAQQRDPGPAGKRANRRLIERSPARRQQHQRPGTAGAGDRRVEHVGTHHHARPAAKRRIVNGAVFIAREIADVHRFQPPDARPQRLAGQRTGERSGQHFRKDRQDRCAPGHARSFSARPGGREGVLRPGRADPAADRRPAGRRRDRRPARRRG